MELFGSKPETFYRSEVPPEVSEAFGRLLLQRYPIAFDKAEDQWAEPELHDALPHLRRAEIETALVALRGLAGVRVEAVRNPTGNAFHREVAAGRVVITESKVDGPYGPIRDAIHRRTLAMRSQTTLDLLHEGQAMSDDDAPLWACFVHLPTKRQDHPAMVRLAFPFPDGSWEHSISLFNLVPTLSGYSTSEELVRLREELRRQRRAG